MKQLSCLNLKVIHMSRTYSAEYQVPRWGKPRELWNVTQPWAKDHLLTGNVKRKSYTHWTLIDQEHHRAINMHALLPNLPPPMANLSFPCSFYSATEISCLLNISIWNKDLARKRKKLILLTPRKSRANFDTSFQKASSRDGGYAGRHVCWPRCSTNVL